MEFPVTPVTAVTEENVRFYSDFTWRTNGLFHPEKLRFWSKTRGEKGKFPATPHLAPTARRVAACGPICGLAGWRWGTDTTRPIWGRVGELFGAPKKQQEKGVASCAPHPGHFCPQCGQLRDSTTGVVERHFRRAVGSKTEKSPAVTEQTAGSQLNFKEEHENDKQQRKVRFLGSRRKRRKWSKRA